MRINKIDYIVTVLRRNPGELCEIVASALTTFKYRFIKRCTGKNTIIRRGTTVVNCGNVQIGVNCIIQDFVYIRAGAKGAVIFANDCMINSFCRFFGHGGIEVGQYCQFGPGVTVTTTDHNYREEHLPESFKKVIIGKRVWIGANVTILPGVTIGDNTVVGAGSIVAKSLPPNSVAVGVPAKVVKSFALEEDPVRKLQKLMANQ
jgi:acetyltransferase-like isoleucine patch superfamily enzyme